MKALKAELLKLKGSSVVWSTFAAFALAPIMGGIFMLIMRDPEAMAKNNALNAKIQAMGIEANWDAMIMILTQGMGVGGIMVFGFVASWIFGREFSDGTAKDLLALPTSRTSIINAKFLVYAGWCMTIAFCNLLIGITIGFLLQLPGGEILLEGDHLKHYLVVTLLTIAVGTPIGSFASWGGGYLMPLGFIGLILVFAQVVSAVGYGIYFPWAVPGLLSGAGGTSGSQLNVWSYLILVFISIAGYFATVFWWRNADHMR